MGNIHWTPEAEEVEYGKTQKTGEKLKFPSPIRCRGVRSKPKLTSIWHLAKVPKRPVIDDQED